jgi:hypothetical protein
MSTGEPAADHTSIVTGRAGQLCAIAVNGTQAKVTPITHCFNCIIFLLRGAPPVSAQFWLLVLTDWP